MVSSFEQSTSSLTKRQKRNIQHSSVLGPSGESWRQQIKELELFKAAEGHCNVPWNHPLWGWLGKTRKRWEKKELMPDQIKDLMRLEVGRAPPLRRRAGRPSGSRPKIKETLALMEKTKMGQATEEERQILADRIAEYARKQKHGGQLSPDVARQLGLG